MKSIKSFVNTKTGRHIYSFIKTFIVAFISIALFADQQGQDIFTTIFVIEAAKASSLVVIRNIYKLLTES